jgi:hypothetical protein
MTNSTHEVHLTPLPVEVVPCKIGLEPGQDNSEEDLEKGYQVRYFDMKVLIPSGYEAPKIRIAADAIPADTLFNALKQLPDCRQLKVVTAIPHSHPDEQQLRELHNDPAIRLVYDCAYDCTVTLYLPPNETVDLLKALRAAFSKIMRNFATISEKQCFDRWFQTVGLIEVEALPACDSAAEAWALLGELVFAEDPTAGLVALQSNPVLGCLWGTALKRVLADVPPKLISSNHDRYVRTAEFLSAELKEQALSELQNRLSACKADAAESDTLRACIEAVAGR